MSARAHLCSRTRAHEHFNGLTKVDIAIRALFFSSIVDSSLQKFSIFSTSLLFFFLSSELEKPCQCAG